MFHYEGTMKDTDRDAPEGHSVAVSQALVFVGSRRFVSVALWAGFPLITQRSLVQIQPPQPNNTKG